jgi:hypothetical protein
LLGDEATAKKIIKDREPRYTIKDLYLREGLVEIAADLSDKTIVKRFIQEFEQHGLDNVVTRWAYKMRDTATILRIMHQGEQSTISYSLGARLPYFVPYDPALAKKNHATHGIQ